MPSQSFSVAPNLSGIALAHVGAENEENRRLEEATFRQILDAITDMVLVKGPRSRLLWANRAFLEAYGMTNEELAGQLDAPFAEPDFTQQYIRDDHQVFSTGRPLDIPEDPLKTHDGRTLICQTVKSPIFGRDGKVAKTVAVIRDITERKRLETAMVAAKEKAEEGVRAKSAFLATMSHEIRTPLNGVLGMIELLMATPLTGEQRTYATSIEACGRALLGLIGNVLDLSKIEAGQFQIEDLPFGPMVIVEECRLVVAEVAATKGLSLTLTVGPGVPAQVRGDRERLRQVLLNLLSNAVRFTEAGAVSIALTASRPVVGEGPPGDASDGDGRGRLRLELAVEDTGIGMSAETCANLFKPFFQADGSTTRRFGGTGLGLAISKRIVAQMGGSFDVRSAVGAGSRFSFVLPCLEVTARNPAPTGRPTDRPSESGATLPVPTVRPSEARQTSPVDASRPSILVAEDNAINRLLIVRQLALLGHAGEVVSNGSEALTAWRRQHHDVILMDCQMPEMDGFEATRNILAEVRARAATPPVIIAITANASEGDRKRCLDAGMNDYLTKPVSLDDLRRMLQRWCGDHAARSPS